MTKPTALLQCPDCNHPPYKDPRGLASHRRSAHNVVGTSVAARHTRDQKKGKPAQTGGIVDRLRGKFPCPHCDFVAAWKGGLTFHTRKKHPNPERSTALATVKVSQVKPAKPNGHAPHPAEADIGRGLIPEAAIAFTAGRIEELLANASAQFDLPPITFAERVIGLVHAKALR